VRRLLLCARNPDRLHRFASEFSGLRTPVEADTDLLNLAPKADVVICAASATRPIEVLQALPPGAIVCDAGYPKNFPPAFAPPGGAVFFGGHAQASAGIRLDPDLLSVIYPYSLPNVAHACLLEGIALALEKRFEPFSQGRGSITPARVDEIWKIAKGHGIGLPPLFNRDGLVNVPRMAQELHL
jgi:predicted amino acid dehydrogenase